MVVPENLNYTSWLTVKQMMNKHFIVIHPNDSLRTVIQYYQDSRLDTLPVVDNNDKLIGVFPKKRLYKALLDGSSLDDPCTPYIVNEPISVSCDLCYDEVSMVVRSSQSLVDYVVVVDHQGAPVGMIGTAEYLRGSQKLIMTSNVLLESIFNANYEGIIVIDNNGKILRTNPVAEKMFGLISSEIKGLHLEYVLPDLKLFSNRSRGVKQIIQDLPVIVSQMPIMADNIQIGTKIAFVDISDMEQMARELEIVKDLQTNLDGVLNASSDGVFVSDISGYVKYINESGCRLISNTSEAMTGMPIKKLLPSGLPAEVSKTGITEVEVCSINGRNCIVSHIPINKVIYDETQTVGVVSTVYLDDNRLTEEIARKWLSLRQQVQYYRDELEKRGNSFDNLVSKNPAFIKMKKDAHRIARSSSTVLLTGESGVGKDMFAHAIHSASPRANQPFVKVNCAAIPESLLESELFGYAPGSFTGASRKGKTGYFTQAHEGTVFLDEIGDMPLSIQVKILQVLQDKEFMRVGGIRTQKVDVRIIAATNKDLREAISKGAFREDLFYRLNVIQFNLPPLRERSEDIWPLTQVFIQKYNEILGSNVVGITQAAKDALLIHSWPGNIRELENTIERAANYVLEGEIGIEHLSAQIFQFGQKAYEPSSYRAVLSDVDKEMLLVALKKAKGNKSAAARLLKMSRSAFYEKLGKYNLS
ncbi:sigma-54-dependent Fis family transcriptional regulator [Desulfosporosinus nitroreducens]|uniref:Sigma 54-interacting transcriptional regulator n=1 Tax=Desulfosporosinus nitroreducens TaxID=2018668 RepID=A0ABT8QR55_9FIRM|nr:sigma-54-dependent Fis family transcriptional regulator [Desulfosporosinus nitroreducens]MCO1599893.1 sigma 54-interacting transcriptional regulator [Desulfosporosinus nitroreducens]MDO0823064.1 sigma 54-interacting transcriptional regulator [Desulfosporosinus nitroreducens]